MADGARHAADVVAAGLLLLFAAPLLAVCALAVLIESGRPVFFGHRRLGRDGRPFRCWKLRTMLPGAEELLERDAGLKSRYVQNGFKLRSGEDPRVTRVGRWLRRRHLDELPQLINVLGGSMSLVGPRPVVPAELTEYGPQGADLLRVKPGITGAWTSLGRRRPDYPERARLELDYVRNRGIRADLAILLRSIPAVLQGAPDP
ncbi:MAG TPA: sugar transferase [Gemmatimonadales bacterium]|nr:sugar transferase [Gemmatimonadales bacterium]